MKKLKLKNPLPAVKNYFVGRKKRLAELTKRQLQVRIILTIFTLIALSVVFPIIGLLLFLAFILFMGGAILWVVTDLIIDVVRDED